MLNSLAPYGLQHARLSCPSLSPRVCSNSCPLSQCCHPTSPSSAVPFSSCLQSFPASESLPMNWLFSSGGQSIGASNSVSVLPVSIYDGFPLGFFISLLTKGLSRLFSHSTFQKHKFSVLRLFMVQFSQPYMTLGKTISLAIWTFVGKVMSLLFNILSRLGRAFLPRSKCHLISWLQSPSAVILESKKIVCHCFYFFSLSICLEVMGLDAMIFIFEC